MRDWSTQRSLWSPELFSFFELPEAEHAPDGEEFYRRLDPHHAQEIGKLVTRCVREGSGFDVEYNVITRGGRLRRLRSCGHVMPSASGRGFALFGTALDITALDAAQRALKKVTTYLRQNLGSEPRSESSAGRNVRNGLPAHLLRRVITLAEENLASGLSVAEMAASIRLSPSHFVRAFKRSTGVTPHQFLLDLRLERARAALLETRNIGPLVSDFGFFDQSHFTRHFRKKFGLTPGAFMRSANSR